MSGISADARSAGVGLYLTDLAGLALQLPHPKRKESQQWIL